MHLEGQPCQACASRREKMNICRATVSWRSSVSTAKELWDSFLPWTCGGRLICVLCANTEIREVLPLLILPEDALHMLGQAVALPGVSMPQKLLPGHCPMNSTCFSYHARPPTVSAVDTIMLLCVFQETSCPHPPI